MSGSFRAAKSSVSPAHLQRVRPKCSRFAFAGQDAAPSRQFLVGRLPVTQGCASERCLPAQRQQRGATCGGFEIAAGSDVAVALDVQEHARLAEELDAAGPPRESERTVGRPAACGSATACRPIARRARAASIRTATPSSSTSTTTVDDVPAAAASRSISVDTKKKELVGDFKNGGREWQPQGQPEQVQVHDFLDKATGQGDSLRRLRHGRQRRAGSAWASTTTRRSSRSTASGAGGGRWAGRRLPAGHASC